MVTIFGRRRAFAAYATTASLHHARAFKAPSLFPVEAIGVAHRHPARSARASPSTFAMSAAASPEAETRVNVAANISSVKRKMEDALVAHGRREGSVRLVAVSKTKPVELLAAAYEAGQRHFGENYAQELMAKSKEMPDDVSWHFIGPLQSNKAAPLVRTVGVKKLACIESVSTLKLALKLNRAVEALNEQAEDKQKLGIYVQVNTSGEESKSGVSPRELCHVTKQISEECPWLSIEGLMTIGAAGDASCFDTLVTCREEIAAVLGREPQELELSMGMSGDFEVAIAKGATSVRVGSTIFGQRDYSDRK